MAKNPRPWVLGISASHNGAACLTHGERIVVAMQEERLLGAKRAFLTPARPSLAVNYCLEAGGITPAQLDLVVLCPRGPSDDPGNDIRQNPTLEIDRHGTELAMIPHHLGHAISTFATSGFAEAAVLVIDGAGSVLGDLTPDERRLARPDDPEGHEIISSYAARNGIVVPLDKQMTGKKSWVADVFYGTLDFMPSRAGGMSAFGSLGGMFSAAAQQIFGDPMEAGKVMGLASLGNPVFPVETFLDISADGLVRYKNAIIEHFAMTERYPHHEQAYADLAASMQKALEFAVLRIVHDLHARMPVSALAYSGGVALNGIVNERLIRESPFDDIHIFPAAEDSGVAVGAALWGARRLAGSLTPRRVRRDSFGRRYGADEVETAFRRTPNMAEIPCRDPIAAMVDHLCEGAAVGWFEGGSELGPRALGHRSILLDPRRPDGKDMLNARIKHREAFRPFAPIVLLDRADEWFDAGDHGLDSPFMLRVVPFKAGREKEVPATAHVDGTGRLQTIERDGGPIADVLKEFERRTGTPILLNTSFNIQGEPIVETPEDALWCMAFSGLDVCCIEGRLFRIADRSRSSLDLVPVVDKDGIAYSKAENGGDRMAWRTRWGTCLVDVPEPWAWAPALLHLADGRRTARDVVALLAAATGRTPTEFQALRMMALLRRLGVARLNAPTGPH